MRLLYENRLQLRRVLPCGRIAIAASTVATAATTSCNFSGAIASTTAATSAALTTAAGTVSAASSGHAVSITYATPPADLHRVVSATTAP